MHIMIIHVLMYELLYTNLYIYMYSKPILVFWF